MELRGERECTDCGARWSYYETGEINCPDCGSIRSVGTGERAEHTAGAAALDLSPATRAVDEEPFERVAGLAAEQARAYLADSGFVHAGQLQALSETYLAAAELRRTGATLERAMRVDDDERRYFLSLLRGATEDGGERPAPAAVPDSLRAGRGLAVAAAAEAYAADIRRLEPDEAAGGVLSTIRSRRKRIEALDGEVDPADAEGLVRALRDVGTYVREGEETALARARDRLD